ncbi:MAG TPA: PilZ domain-containing protein [Terriglobales bacterium]|nr:PilZ domain-containing protein [Terriglobales bacterium]
MNLQALLLCSDDKIVRVLRRVLNDLEITVEHCADPELAILKLSRRRFEAVIVDCEDTEVAAQILKAARNAPANKKAVAVAIVNEQHGLRSAFEFGAHFVLYKPISTERARSSFRAARALMKCERRRAARVPVEMPVMYRFLKYGSDGPVERTVSVDLSEDGVGIRLSRRHRERGPMHVQFKLPGSNRLVEAESELAWENPNGQAGLRFLELPSETRQALKNWLKVSSPDSDEDPPAPCKLSDLSLGGCYLETPAPFPVRARLSLRMKVGQLQVRASGSVKVMHPEVGMGVIFIQKTAEQRKEVEGFIQALMDSNGVEPELVVEPDGLEPFVSQRGLASPQKHSSEDPLIDLFENGARLSTEEFLEELRKQRNSGAPEQALSENF